MPTVNGVWRPHNWDDWEIDLVDGSLDTIGVLDEAIGCAVEWALYGFGKGSLSLHILSDRADDLLEQGQFYFRFYRGGVQVRDWMLAKDDRGYTVANQNVDEYIEVMLSPLDMILQGKTCIPENEGETFESTSLPLDDGFKWIVDHVCGPNAYDSPESNSRVMTGMTVAADLSDHGTTAVISEAHRMDLFEFLQKYGPTWGIDWRVRLEKTSGIANQFVFETFTPGRGLDKTETNGVRQPVILNDASGEITSARRFRPRLGFYNVIIAKDLGTEVVDATSVSAYGRREMMADTSDENKLEELLETRSQREGYEWEFAESEMCEVGTDADQFQPGDEVTISNDHLSIDARDETVKMVALSVAAGESEKAKLTFGQYDKTVGDKIKEAGGGSRGFYYDPVLGLRGDAGDLVPFTNEDPSVVTIEGTTDEIDVTEDIPNNTLTISLHATVTSQLHAAVTLDANADTLLSLSTQELGLDTQAANLVFAGPTGGGAAVPSFRSLVADDIPDLSGSYAASPHDIVGAVHSITGAALSVVGATATDTLGLLTPSANVGDTPVSALLKSSAAGDLHLATVTLEDTGLVFDNFVNSGLRVSSDVGEWSDDDHLAMCIDWSRKVIMSGSALYSNVNNGMDLGGSSNYWSTAYITDITLGADIQPDTHDTGSVGVSGAWFNIARISNIYSGRVETDVIDDYSEGGLSIVAATTITGDLAVTGDITVTGTVDGVDVGGLESDYDAHIHTLSGITSNSIAGSDSDYPSSVYTGTSVGTGLENSLWFRCYTSKANAEADSGTIVGRILMIHRVEHWHAMSGSGDRGWESATATMSTPA